MHFFLTALTLLWAVSRASFLPGISPTNYDAKSEIPLYVNHLTPSRHFQHKDKDGNNIKSDKEHYLYSYDYYNSKLHFCKPENVIEQAESLGSVLFGDRLYNSPFKLNMLEDKSCVSLCKSVIPGEDAAFINKLIKNGFLHNWLVDGLPAGTLIYNERESSAHITNGFPLGSVEIMQGVHNGAMGNPREETGISAHGSNVVVNLELPHLNNHYDITIQYHEPEAGKYRIVGVEVEPKSIKQTSNSCEFTGEQISLSEDQDNEVLYTYSVKYERFSHTWATRWDNYRFSYDTTVQWFSLISCVIVVIGLSSVVLHMLLRALKSDFARYNELNLDDEFHEESGWKLSHGDVFRMPNKSLLLSVLVGSGVQLLLLAVGGIVIAAIAFNNAGSREVLPTIFFVLYALFGFVGSYASMGVYKFFKGPYPKVNMILTPFLIPGLILLTIISLNFFLLIAHSSDAIPFSALFAVVLLWLIISVPLSLAGSLTAIKTCSWDQHPTKTNQIARQIPFQPWYLKTLPAALVAGIFPFASIAVELYFIYNSLWFHQFFYMFGFSMVSLFLLVLTTALVTVMITYHSLCLENWQWQWRSFIVGGLGSAVYIFIHSIFFTEFKLRGFTTIVLYVGYSMLISILCCLTTGAVGFFSSMFLVRKIFSSVKVD